MKILGSGSGLVLAASIAVAVPALGSPEDPGALALIAALRETYAGLGAYRDRGTVEEVRPGGEPVPVGRFETAVLRPDGDGGFRFAWTPAGGAPRTVWSAGGETFHEISGSTLRSADPPGPATLHRLAPGAAEALAVPALLLGDPAALEVAAASSEGTEPCGEASCRVVAVRTLGGLDYRLWIDPAARLVRRLEVEVPEDAALLARAAADAGLPPPPGVAPIPTRVLAVRFEIDSEPPPLTLFAPPTETPGAASPIAAGSGLAGDPPGSASAGGVPGSSPATTPSLHREPPATVDVERRAGLDEPAATATPTRPPAATQPLAPTQPPAASPTQHPAAPATRPPFSTQPLPSPSSSTVEPQHTFEDRIEVSRVVLEVRAIAPGGEAIEGLGAGDFRVRLGGREARIESVDWLPGGGGSFEELSWGEAAAGLAETGATVEPPEELTLVFVQADMEPSRVIGHLRMLQRTELLFGGLAPGDRMAVVSFDSRLRLRQDFTDDPAALARALEEGIGFGGEPPRIPPGPYPSLARHFDYQAAHDAANPERALEVAARALAPIPGRKSILLLGYGLGRFDARAGTVSMTADYRAAREVLTAARIPVFVLDIVDAAAHSLEVGLQQVAEDTGGRYERTAFFPSAAIKRIRRVMDGRYLLVFAVPAGLPPGEHKLRIGLVGRNGEVLAPPTLGVE